MVLKYCLNLKKRFSISQLISYILIFLTEVFITFSIMGMVLDVYNQYTFIQNFSVSYGRNSRENSGRLTRIQGIALRSNYKEEFSLPYNDYFKNYDSITLFVSNDGERLFSGTFRNNILEYSQALVDTVEEDCYPVLLGYDLLYRLDVSMGDYIQLYRIDKAFCRLRVCGVLRPYYFDLDMAHSNDNSLAITIMDYSASQKLEKSYMEDSVRGDPWWEPPTYITFTDDVKESDSIYYSRDTEQGKITAYIQKNIVQILFNVLAGLGIVAMISLAETNFTLKRNQKNFMTLRCLGMGRREITLISAATVGSEFLIASVFAAGFTAFWLKFVLYRYCSVGFLLLIFAIEILIAIIASYIYSLIRSRKNGVYRI